MGVRFSARGQSASTKRGTRPTREDITEATDTLDSYKHLAKWVLEGKVLGYCKYEIEG